jgi:hypothetical protein
MKRDIALDTYIEYGEYKEYKETKGTKNETSLEDKSFHTLNFINSFELSASNIVLGLHRVRLNLINEGGHKGPDSGNF